MNYYDKNLECIKINKKFLYESLINLEYTSSVKLLDDIYSVQAKNGEQALVIKKDGKEYRLNSMYSPSKEAKSWGEQYKYEVINNIISMFGMGNGVFAKEIIEKMSNSDVMLIYEPSIEIFLHVLHNYDITELLVDRRIVISVEDVNDLEFHNTLQSVINISNLKHQYICSHPKYEELFSNSYLKFLTDLKESYNHVHLKINTNVELGDRIINNIFNNFKYFNDSYLISELKNKIPNDIPAIIIAGGPSVEENIEEIKRAKGKSVIFAVDRILDFLLEHNIEPDFVVSVDPKKPLIYFSKRDDIQIPLICFTESNSEILEKHAGKKIIANCSQFIRDIYNTLEKKSPELVYSGSVATVTFSVCLELGFETIILVGQDLAYKGSVTHAGGVEEKSIDNRVVLVDDIHGEKVKSRYDWKEFIRWYEDIIKLNQNVKVVDAKLEGAKIKGTETMGLSEAIELYCKKEYIVSTIFKTIRPEFNENEILKIKEILSENELTLDEIKIKVKKAIKLCNNVILDIKMNKNESESKKSIVGIKKTNEYIMKQPIYCLLDLFISANYSFLFSDIYEFSNNIKEDSIKTYEKTRSIFNVIIEAVDYIKPRLEQAIEDIV